LKAYVVDRQRGALTLSQAVEARRKAGEKLPNILGDKGHNLALLLSLTDLESQLTKDTERAKDWATCLKWKSTWRYDPVPPDPTFAIEFVAAAQRVYEWLRRHIR
jgi:hypothetical protein